jgi:hypothetical protein
MRAVSNMISILTIEGRFRQAERRDRSTQDGVDLGLGPEDAGASAAHLAMARSTLDRGQGMVSTQKTATSLPWRFGLPCRC